jgi:hypothetical protein
MLIGIGKFCYVYFLVRSCMKIIVLISLLFCGRCVGQITFQKTYASNLEDKIVSILETYDGGYLASGITYFPTIDSEFVFLFKTDITGDTLWTRTYSILDNVYYGRSIQTMDGGFAVIGTVDNHQNFDQDLFFLKTDISGIPIWAKTYGGINGGFNTHDQAISVEQTSDGGYIIGAVSNSLASGDDIYLIRIDANGDTLWTKSFGGASSDRCSAVMQSVDSGFMVLGWTSSFGDGQLDIFLIKTNANGDTLWTKCYYGDSAYYDMESIIETRDSGFVMSGVRSHSPWLSGDAYFLKVDSSGNPLLSKTYNSGHYTGGMRMIETVDNNYIIAGIVTGSIADSANFYLLKIDANGDTLFTKTYEKAMDYYNYNVSIVQAYDSGFVLAGSTNLYGAGDNDNTLIKTNSGGVTTCNGSSKPTSISSPLIQVESASSAVSGLVTIVNSVIPVLVNVPMSVTTQCMMNSSVLIEDPSSISFSPNPFIYQIKVTSTDKGEIIIYDSPGKEILRQNIFAGESIIPTDRLSPGLYFLHYSSEKKLANFKLLKY